MLFFERLREGGSEGQRKGQGQKRFSAQGKVGGAMLFFERLREGGSEGKREAKAKAKSKKQKNKPKRPR